LWPSGMTSMSDHPLRVQGADWLRLRVLIEQTEARIALWEAEERVAERRWHRGVREVDRRGLTNPDTIASAYVKAAAVERVWVPEVQLKQDRDLLLQLYELRRQMLACTDGSECEGGA
jgi:hypothetical protein